MPRNASGTVTLPTNDSNPAAPRNVIRSSDFNELMTDITTELTDSWSRSGKGAALADLDMDGFDLLNPGNLPTNARAVNTGTGLTGGGNLSADRTIALNAASIASLLLADSSVQPGDPDSDLNFLQAGTDAVARTTRSKGRDVLNAADFGVSTAASASVNRAAFQAAINQAKALQCRLEVNSGTYDIDAALDITECSSVWINGNGGATIIRTTSTSAAIFSATGAVTIDGFHLSNIKLSSSATRTNAPYIVIDPTIQYSYFTNVFADNYGGLLWLKKFIQVQIAGCRGSMMSSPPSASFAIKLGTQAGSNQGANLYLRDSIFFGNGSGSSTQTNWTVGLIMYDVEGVFASGLDLQMHDMNALGDPQTRLANCFFDSCFFDSTQRGPCFRFQGTGVKADIEFTASWFASAGRSGTPTAADGAYGFQAIGSGDYGRMMHTGCRFLNNAGNGVLISTTNYDGDFNACNWYFNSVIDSGPAFNTSTTGVAPNLKDGKFTSNGGGATAVTYGASSTGYVVANLICDAQVSLAGTPNRISDIVATNSPSIASAAALTLVPFYDTQTVTGTTTITSINASWGNRTVQLLFAAGLTVTHGANLVLKGAVNATPASGGIMTFFYNGSGQWREVSRNF